MDIWTCSQRGLLSSLQSLPKAQILSLINTLGLAKDDSSYGRKDKYGYKGVVLTPQKKYALYGAASQNDATKKATPLVFAVIGGHLDVIKFLIENGADVNKKNNGCGASALEIVERNRLKSVLKVFEELEREKDEGEPQEEEKSEIIAEY
ncbi:hypothetical protein G9A89_010066 [Geosiphon pyriformis]|nr:hypothetical protein G9A89_010066 [Geosiphon pyriformis]